MTAAVVLIIVLGIFAVGVVAGIVVVVSLGVRREDGGPFLPEAGPDQLTRGARRLTGLWVRQVPAHHRDHAGQDLHV